VNDREAQYRTPRLSPNGAQVAVAMQDAEGNEDIWLVNVGAVRIHA
jgi:hypothetical protein